MTQKKQQMETQIKKNVDELNECKKHKHFLDILAIQAGLKKFIPNAIKVQDQESILGESMKSGAGKRRTKVGGATFGMTEVEGSPSKQGRKVLGPNKDLSEQSRLTLMSQQKRSQIGSRSSGPKGQLVPQDASDDESKYHEPDLNDAYEDDDLTIYFKRDTLLAQIVKLEDDNLRKIDLVQDDEQNLERQNKQEAVNYKKLEDQIKEVQKNIDVLHFKKVDMMSKKDFLNAGQKDKDKKGITSPSNKRAVMSGARQRAADAGADKDKQGSEGDTQAATKQAGKEDVRT